MLCLYCAFSCPVKCSQIDAIGENQIAKGSKYSARVQDGEVIGSVQGGLRLSVWGSRAQVDT